MDMLLPQQVTSFFEQLTRAVLVTVASRYPDIRDSLVVLTGAVGRASAARDPDSGARFE
jgi:hypothetical protein